MGANNKLQATYHGGERTPDTEEVEDSYTMDQVQISLRKSTVVAREEFRRWLETVRAEAKAEAWDECANHISDVDDFAPPRLAGELKRANPYKENQS